MAANKEVLWSWTTMILNRQGQHLTPMDENFKKGSDRPKVANLQTLVPVLT